MMKRIVNIVKRTDKVAVKYFNGFGACAKSFAISGMVSSVIIGICACCAAVYILVNGYSDSVNEIICFFIDRCAAIPAISLLGCLISEIMRGK